MLIRIHSFGRRYDRTKHAGRGEEEGAALVCCEGVRYIHTHWVCHKNHIMPMCLELVIRSFIPKSSVSDAHDLMLSLKVCLNYRTGTCLDAILCVLD
jgi:hypothetical protein